MIQICVSFGWVWAWGGEEGGVPATIGEPVLVSVFEAGITGV